MSAPFDVTQPVECSYAQEHLWLGCQLVRDQSLYNIPVPVRLEGALNVRALETAFDCVIERHDVFRYRFDYNDQRLEAWVVPHRRFVLPVTDLSGESAAVREQRAAELVDRDAYESFALDGAPLIRCRLIRLGTTDHILSVTVHHLAFDAWSISVLWREIAEGYAAAVTGRAPNLPALPVRYAEFARWQRRRGSDVHQRQIDYWHSMLDDVPELDFPGDRRRPAALSGAGSSVPVQLSKSLASAVGALGQRHGCTLFMTLLASWQLLLARHSGQADIAVGTAVNHRYMPETHGLIGCFVNTLVLRTNLAGTGSVCDLLPRVRGVALDAFENADVPFPVIVQAIHPGRTAAASPFFRTMFGLQVPRPTELLLPELRLRPVDVTSRTTKFDLNLQLSERSGAICGTLTYSSDLFDAATARRIANRWTTLLRRVVDKPSANPFEVPLVGQAERRRLAEWNDTGHETAHALVHEQFAQVACARPDALAVVCRGRGLSYADLNGLAERWANVLFAAGVRSEMVVGIHARRDINMVAAVLAVLKVGGCYLPLDPNLPAPRLRYLIEDAKPAVVLSESDLMGRLPPCAADIRALDSEPGEAAPRFRRRIAPESAAYIIYTSGSTGHPKGVVIEHRQIANYVASVCERTPLGAGMTFAMLQPLSVDSSATMLFASLCKGGCLHLVPDEMSLDAVRLAAYFASESIDCLKIAPSHLAALHGATSPREIMPRRCLVVGGESSLRAWLSALQRESPDCAIYNHYGPTETTVGVLMHRVSPTDRGDSTVMPVGRPLANTQTFVLDARGEPVPIGVRGELHVGGAAVGRGYVGRPDLTAERFVPDHLSGSRGGRLYRTGDVGRWRQDGTLEYEGRGDEQVKIRGYRIELGEVEGALRRQSEIKDAAAAVRDGRLVGYVVWAREAGKNWAALRNALSRELPDYMVPTVWHALASLPLSAHGKLDRRRLPDPAGEARELESVASPRNSAEQALLAIWRDVLHVEQIGIHDNFFELGGDSILSIQIVARAQKTGLPLRPQMMFERQTIADLAEHLTTHQQSTAGPADLADVMKEQAPLTPMQRWFVGAELSEPRHWNMSVLLALDRTHLNASAWRAVLQALVDRHEALRTRLRRADGGWVQEVCPAEGSWTWGVWDFASVARDAQSSALAARIEAAQRAVDHEQGPVLSAALIDLGPSGGRLLIVVHHVAIDGVSWRILLEELERGFEQSLTGERLAWPPVTITPRKWAARLAELAQSEPVLRQRVHWTGAPTSDTRLPVEIDAGDNDEGSAEWIESAWPREWTTSFVRNVSPRARADAQQLLLASIAGAVTEWAGGEGLWVEIEGHGRDETRTGMDTSQTVGWFTARYPVWIGAPLDAPAARWLVAVKHALHQVPDKGLGFGLLRYLGSPESANALRALPPTEIGFNYLGQFDSVLDGRVLRPATESVGPQRGPSNRRRHLLEVTAMIRRGELSVRWVFSRHVHRRETIERLARSAAGRLEKLATLARTSPGELLSPTDFPHARLDERTLQVVAARLGGD